MMKKIKDFLNKKNKSKIVCLTSFSKNIANILDRYCDVILVGDSLANVLYGMKNTHGITVSTMANHGASVKAGVKKSLLVIDMPKNSYNTSRTAIKNAKFLIKKSKCDALKIESNSKNFHIITALTNIGIKVMGHIGYTPQFKKKFKIQGLTKRDEKKLLLESKEIEKAGAFGIVLECIKKETAKKITKELKIPTIGIGSSVHCDGQILVTEDILGLSGFYPKFVKKYINLNKIIEKSVQKYRKEVITRKFPNKNNSY